MYQLKRRMLHDFLQDGIQAGACQLISTLAMHRAETMTFAEALREKLASHVTTDFSHKDVHGIGSLPPTRQVAVGATLRS